MDRDRVKLDMKTGQSLHLDLTEVAAVAVLQDEVYVNFRSGDSWIVLKSDDNLRKLASVMVLDTA